jgi:hypothetical protein
MDLTVNVTSEVTIVTRIPKESRPTIDTTYGWGVNRKQVKAEIDKITETLSGSSVTGYRISYSGSLLNADGQVGRRGYQHAPWDRGDAHPEVATLAVGEEAMRARFTPATYTEDATVAASEQEQ